MIDRFEIDHVFPSRAANRWLSAMVVLFSSQIKHLLHAGDAKIAKWRAADPDADVFGNRKPEVISELNVDIDRQKAAVEEALG